jgi:hypothetical protein
MNLESALRDELVSYIKQLAEIDESFTSSTALLKYGRHFSPVSAKPEWLRIGEQRDCFNNATKAAVQHSDVLYAEGYVLEPELQMPVQHAWLIDASGGVVDPTYPNTNDHAYFGIAFRGDFVVDMLTNTNGQAGLLVNLHLLRRKFRDPALLENVIKNGMA